jgi:hypothetical protein
LINIKFGISNEASAEITMLASDGFGYIFTKDSRRLFALAEGGFS